MVGWARGGAGERQAAREGGAFHPAGCGGAPRLRERRPGVRSRRGGCGPGTGAPGDRGRKRGVRPAVPRRGCGPGPGLRRRSRLALLHERHHRASQGRDAHPRQPRAHDAQLFRERRRRGARRPPAARRAPLPRLRPLHLHAPREGRGAGGSGVGRVRRRRGAGAPRAPPPRVDVRRADDGQAPHAGGAALGPIGAGAADAGLRGRADVPRGHPAGDAGVRQPLRADLRPGGEPHDHRRTLESPSRGHAPPAPRRAARPRSVSPTRGSRSRSAPTMAATSVRARSGRCACAAVR